MNEKKKNTINFWLVTLGIGAIAFILKTLFEEFLGTDKEFKKRIFISFAIEDSKYRDYLVSQAKNEKSPFAFVDMSVKQPWDKMEWKRKCRSKIKSCDGMIVLLSKNTWHSSGARWEIKCAREERIPVIGMHVQKNDKGAIPPELNGKKIITWSWDNLDNTIKKF